MSSSRTYTDAINALNTLQSNSSVIRQSATELSVASRDPTRNRFENKLALVKEYLGRIGYTPEDLNVLNVIHVTGTKGKGSTCAMVDSILRQTHPRWKIGLYTSPHLVAVRERIRINGSPITEEQFTIFFFEVWDKLGVNQMRADPSTPLRPMYFRFLTLMAYHVFLSLKVDVTVLEVGIGGLHDDTNIVPRPVVTGVSSVGYDHMNILGHTLAEIAYQKGGIFKEGVPAFTVEQSREPLESLKLQAIERKASRFEVIKTTKQLQELSIGLPGKHQIQNAALAVRLAVSCIATMDPESSDSLDETWENLPSDILSGLKLAKWPGRCQVVQDPKLPALTWFLDGAHTQESLKCCFEWFVSPEVSISNERPLHRVLVFNCTKGRSGHVFLETILSTIEHQLRANAAKTSASEFFSDVIFCTNVTYADGGFKGDLLSVNLDFSASKLDTQHDLATSWAALVPSFPKEHIHVLPSIEHATQFIKALPAQVHALITGSLHLVGGAIEAASLSSNAL